MNKTTVSLCGLVAVLVSGCQVSFSPPVASVEVSAPAVEVVPPTYVWDGYEYVGEVNGGFYYFGPGGVWIGADPIVLGRWHGYVDVHPDWRARVVFNDREHRLDREHHEGGRAVERRSAAPERRAAPAARKPAPARGKEEKKKDESH